MNKESTLLALLVVVSGCLVFFFMGNLSKHEHEYSAIVGYENTTTVWSKEELKHIYYDEQIKNPVEMILSPCHYGDFKEEVVSRLKHKWHKNDSPPSYEPMFQKLRAYYGIVTGTGKHVVVFSMTATSIDEVGDFLDSCAESMVSLYPKSQKLRLDRSISLLRQTADRQQRTLLKAIERKNKAMEDGKTMLPKLQEQIDVAQRLYDELRQRLLEAEKTSCTNPLPIKIVKRASDTFQVLCP